MKKILVTGKNGQIGWELQRTLAPLGKVIAIGRDDVDFTDSKALVQFVRQVQPDIIVNAAAYTAVDQAEKDVEMASAINAIAPRVLAEEAASIGAIFVHYSTDYVFNGNSVIPYREEDMADPLNIYGRTKHAGELAVQKVNGKHLILRTSWVYGSRGKNFLLTMLRLGKERAQLRVVNDQIGAPTWSRSIADVTYHLLAQEHSQWGIYHLTSAGETSWHGFAEAIFRFYKEHCERDFRIPEVVAIPTSEYPTPACRPKNSVLDNAKIRKTFGCVMPEWQDALKQCFKDF